MGLWQSDFRISQVAVAVGFNGQLILPGNSLRRYLRFTTGGFGSVFITPRNDDILVQPPFIIPQNGFLDLEYTKHGPLVTSNWYQISSITAAVTIIECFYVNQGA